MTNGPGRRAALTAALAALSLPARGQQGWPDRPVRILNPGSPGAFNDTFGRLVGDRLQEALGQPFLTDNRPGAGGSLATAAVARAAPDGYTIGVANLSTLIFNHFLYAAAGYDPARDFAPVAVGARLMNLLAVHPGSGIGSVSELLARARANPGRLSYATSGSGSTPHLAGELFNQTARVDIQHVPYRGSAPAVSDVVVGSVPILYDNVPNALVHVESGRLRALAVTGTARHPALPEVPTLQEAGLAGFEMHVWFGLVAPAGTPVPILRRLSAEVLRAVGTPEVAARIARAGAEPWAREPEAFAGLIRAELAKWKPVVRASGARVD